MNDIDKLIRETLRDAKETPPAEVWEAVSQRLSHPASQGKAHRTRRWLTLSATAVGIVAVAAVAIWRLTSTPTASDTLMAHNDMAATVSDEITTPALETTTPEVAQPTAADKTTKSEPRESRSLSTPASVTSSSQESYTVQKQQQAPVAVAPATPSTPNVSTDNTAPLPTEAIQETTLSSSTTAEHSESVTPQTTTGIVTTEKTVPELLIPSLLTPNGDGINDCWVIPGLEQYGQVQVQIYTAQSQRVYSNNDYRNDFCGNGLPEGNYFYVLVLRDYNYSRRGVFVIRK